MNRAFQVVWMAWSTCECGEMSVYGRKTGCRSVKYDQVKMDNLSSAHDNKNKKPGAR